MRGFHTSSHNLVYELYVLSVYIHKNKWKSLKDLCVVAYYMYSWRNDQDTLFFSDKENCKEYLSRPRGLWYLAVRLPERRCHWICHWENTFANWVSTLRVQSLAADWRQQPPFAERVRAAAAVVRKYFASAFLSCWCPFPALDSTIIRTCNLCLSVLRERPVKFPERPVLLPGFTN